VAIYFVLIFSIFALYRNVHMVYNLNANRRSKTTAISSDEKTMIRDSIKTYKHIIWDWNGTLLDDVQIVIDAMNTLLKRRNLPLLDANKYKNIFTFPVKDYYAKLGFDFSLEPFEKLTTEYISEFNSCKYQFRLHDKVDEILNRINNLGISQSILSASQEQVKETSLHSDKISSKGRK